MNVSVRLPGANPETMAATAAAPLERRLGEIPGVTELTSTSNTGSSNITVQFDLDRDIEGAARDVQAAINASGADLPVDLPQPPTYRKVNPADAPILILAITSDQLDLTRLYDICDSVLVPRISQVPGVAQVTSSGAAKPAVRVQVDPVALAGTGLGLDEVRARITAANSTMPRGSLHGDTQSLAIGLNDRISRAADYAQLVLTTNGTTTLRLRDIAQVTDDVENNQQWGSYNKGRGVILIIQKQPDANVIDVVDGIKTLLPQLAQWMPTGTGIHVLADRTQTIRASVHDVERALLISSILVVLVVLFFARASHSHASRKHHRTPIAGRHLRLHAFAGLFIE